MVTIDGNDYGQGLNRGLKIGSFLKRNIKSAQKDISIKNAVKVVKVAGPLALSIIPVAGGTASTMTGKALQKITTNKAGGASLIGRALSGKSGNGTANFIGRASGTISKLAQTEVGKMVVTNATPLVKSAKASLLEKIGVVPNEEQLATLAQTKGTTAQDELDAIVNNTPDSVVATATAKTAVATATPIATATSTKTDYTMPIVIGVGVLGLAYVVTKK